MHFARRRLVAALSVAAAIMTLGGMAAEGFAQSRRRAPEPPPPPSEPLPEISTVGASCSFAFHDVLSRVRDGRNRQLTRFDGLARVTEPGLPGRWLYWNKSAKTGKAATTEQVCAESTERSGRKRCLRWETRKLDPVVVGSQPTGEELAVLRSLDAFVTDRGAPLEFGSNGRQHATLQRFAVEIGAYVMQPRHPALCNGVPEMMDFHGNNIAGVKKRADDVAATAAKAAGLARSRVIASRDQRVAEAKAAAAAPPVPVPGQDATPIAPATTPAPAAAPRIPEFAEVPTGLAAARLLPLVLEGLLPAERISALTAEGGTIRQLQSARDLVSSEALPALNPATRAALGAALRMIEAAAYSEMQVGRLKQFSDLFLGTIEEIREGHRTHCTCGE